MAKLHWAESPEGILMPRTTPPRAHSLTSPSRIRAVEKQRQALELRMAGRTLAEIAKMLGYANHAGADYAIKTALRKTLEPTAAEFRSLALERLTKVLQVHWPAMLQHDEKASILVLRTIKDIRELLGLDAPQKLDIRMQVEELALQYGLSPEELLREAQAIIIESQKALPKQGLS